MKLQRTTKFHIKYGIHYIYMYIITVAKSVTLCLHLRHNFGNIIFKIIHKLRMASDSVPPPPSAMKISGCTYGSHM